MKMLKGLAESKYHNDSLEKSLSMSPSEIPISELEKMVSQMFCRLEQAQQFVNEQQIELADQIKIIPELEAKLQSASDSNRQSLVQELAERKESLEMMENSVTGQLRNLHNQEVTYCQYKKLLQTRKQHFNQKGNKCSDNSRDSKKISKSSRGRNLANAVKPLMPEALITKTATSAWQWRMTPLGLLMVGVAAGLTFSIWFTFGRSSPMTENSLTMEQSIQQYEKRLQRNPSDFKILEELTTLYLEKGELELARPLMEKIVQLKPESLKWQLNLATIYELTENWQEAEAIYDRILSNNNNHFQSLLSKAYLRSKQGDLETARSLFAKAERVATTNELKAKVREMAEQAL